MDRALIEMLYSTDSDRHTLFLHVRPVSLVPVGLLQDLAYLDPPSAPFAETSILATFGTFSVLWSAFYPPRWSLQLVGVWQQNGEASDLIPVLPSADAVSGADSVAPLGYQSVRRTYSLYSGGRRARRLHLRQIPGVRFGVTANLRADGGGFDDRDQRLLGYLSGPRTAALTPDGDAFAAVSLVRATLDRPLPPLSTLA